MPNPIDYSKWKDIEVSDDEDDTHPNIDTPSLFRWRHQARLERMAEKKMKQEQLEKEKTQTTSKLQELETKMTSTNISSEEKSKLEKDLAAAKEDEQRWLQKEKELEDAERLEKWNIDTIGHEAFSSSRVNKIDDKKKVQPVLSEEEDSKRMNEFFEKYADEIEFFGNIKGGMPALEAYLLEHPHISCDYTATYLTMEALNMAMQENEQEMLLISRKVTIINYLVELAKSLKAIPTHPTVIKAFFKKFSVAEKNYIDFYEKDVLEFQDRLRHRGKEKRDIAMAKYETEAREERIKAAPGGLDPQEVYDSLPAEMKAAFDSQEVARLQKLATTMDKEVFMHHFQRCIDSGLWVPGGSTEDDEAEGAPEEGAEAGEASAQ